MSEFYKAAIALEDFALTKRIQAAVMYHAKTLLAGAVEPSRNFAVASVLQPSYIDPTMVALVAVDAEVTANIVVDEETGQTIDTSAVPDDMILVKVVAAWPLVSTKYQSDPLAV